MQFENNETNAILLQESEQEKAKARVLSDYIEAHNLQDKGNDDLITAIINYKNEVAKSAFNQGFELGCKLTKLNAKDTSETIHDILHLSEQNRRALARNVRYLLEKQQKEEEKALKALQSEQ